MPIFCMVLGFFGKEYTTHGINCPKCGHNIIYSIAKGKDKPPKDVPVNPMILALKCKKCNRLWGVCRSDSKKKDILIMRILRSEKENP